MEKAFARRFAKYVSTNIFGMIGISCYILADTFFVAKALGSIGLAALNLSISIYSILHAFGLMIGVGGATRFKILKSQGKDEKAHKVFFTSVGTGIVTGVIFAIIGLLKAKDLALLLGADVSTLPLTQIYLSTILSFSVFFIINNIFLAFARNDNAPNLSMTAMIVGSVSNIILDYVFMFPLEMGMFGAAFATCLAAFISICILLLHFVRKKDEFRPLKYRVDCSLIPDMASLGLSSFIGEISLAVVLITFNLLILGLEGNLGVAAYGIVANLALVGIAVFTGLAQGIQPLASEYYGQKDYVMARKVRRYAVFTSLLLAIVIYFGMFLYCDNVIAVFNSENNARIAAMAETGLQIYFLGFFFAGINLVTAMFFSATENTRDAFILSIARGLVIIVPAGVVLSRIWNMTGVWLAFVLTEFIVTTIGMCLASKQSLDSKDSHLRQKDEKALLGFAKF